MVLERILLVSKWLCLDVKGVVTPTPEELVELLLLWLLGRQFDFGVCKTMCWWSDIFRLIFEANLVRLGKFKFKSEADLCKGIEQIKIIGGNTRTSTGYFFLNSDFTKFLFLFIFNKNFVKLHNRCNILSGTAGTVGQKI